MAAAFLFLVPLLVTACRGHEGAATLPGTRYAAAAAFVGRYCAGCHGERGDHRDQRPAHQVLPLDAYDDWRRGLTVIAAVLDRWHPDGRVMPPPAAPQPTDEERRLMLDWVRRGAPNSADGR